MPTSQFKLATLELETITHEDKITEDKTTEEMDQGNLLLEICLTVKFSPSLAYRIATFALKPEEQMLLNITLLETAGTDSSPEEEQLPGNPWPDQTQTLRFLLFRIQPNKTKLLKM